MHWGFGHKQDILEGDKYPDTICPLSYFSSEDRKVLEDIPIMEKHYEAGATGVCSGDYRINK